MRRWNREYKIVTAIGIILIIAVCLAVWAQLSKETNSVANWLSTFLSDWAMVLSATVMLLLAGAAFWSILDNRHSHLKGLKRRSLDEICSWAQDAIRGLSCPGPTLRVGSAQRVQMGIDLAVIAARNITAKADAKELGSDLAIKVQTASGHLNNFIDNLKYAQNIGEFETVWENLKKDFLAVIASASELRAKTTLERY